jgi:general secretion pathway protein G
MQSEQTQDQVQPRHRTKGRQTVSLRARRRRSREGMTLIEIMVVMVIMALVATAAGFAILPQLRKAKIKQTSGDAKAVASAAELYMSDKDSCPTVQELITEKILDQKKNTKDAWGHDFSIECDQDGVTVRSAGPDGQMGSEDDIQ